MGVSCGRAPLSHIGDFWRASSCGHLLSVITHVYTWLHMFTHFVYTILNRLISCSSYTQLLTFKIEDRQVLSAATIAAFWERFCVRLSSVTAAESMVTITYSMASHVLAMHVHKDNQRKLTGDRTKLLMVTLPFLLRDLAYAEVKIIFIKILLHIITHDYTLLHIFYLICHAEKGQNITLRGLQTTSTASCQANACFGRPLLKHSGKSHDSDENFLSVG